MIEIDSTIKLTSIYAEGASEMRNCATIVVITTDIAKMIILPCLKDFRIIAPIENDRHPNIETKLNLI